MQVFVKMFPNVNTQQSTKGALPAIPSPQFRTIIGGVSRQSTRRTNILLFTCWLCICQWMFPIFRFPSRNSRLGQAKLPSSPHPEDSVEIVVAATDAHNTTWLHTILPHWKKNIYDTHDPNPELKLPSTRGHEAMVYLSYIIDRYDTLPGNMLFHRGERFQWFMDHPDYDSLQSLMRFRVPILKEKGYVNLRCTWILGCPAEIRPSMDENPNPSSDGVIHAKSIYKKAFQELFPEMAVPSMVGTSCCAQFAVHRDRVWKRPREDYIRYRDWLINTELNDELSRRVMEYSWHLMFGMYGVFCPKVETCYCELYGLCDLKCDDKNCDDQYTMPSSVVLPSEWPMKGWNGEDRHWTGQLG